MNVMVVDDRPQDRFALKAALENRGYTVYEAENGLTALEAVHILKPDIVISDILMPKLDGYGLLRAIRQSPDLANMPVIFYTATYLDKEDRDLAASLGVNYYLEKPAEIHQLLNVIQSVVAQPQKVIMQEPVPGDEDAYVTYDERLVEKLEDKVLELEQKNSELVNYTETLAEQNDEIAKQLGNLNSELNKRDSFIQVASHEMNVPLTALKGWLQLTMRNITKVINRDHSLDLSKDQEYLRRATAHTRHLERMTHDFSDTVRYTDAQILLNLQPCNISTLLKRLVLDQQFISKRHGLTLHNESQTDIVVEVDGEKLSRAIGTVLDHVFKFSPDGSQILVTLCHENDSAIISITDTGPGIALEDRINIFEPFYQSELDHSVLKFGGLGLGLYVARRIIEAHRGTLELIDLMETGQSGVIGTEFLIRLPFDIAQSNAAD